MITKLTAVLDILNDQNINASIENERYVVWEDCSNIKNSIYVDDIDLHNGKIAWFQSNVSDSNELFRIYENNSFFDFEPKTLHPGYGCEIYLIEWLEDHLIVIYHEKHNVVISSVKDKEIRTIEFHGDQLIRKGNFLYFRGYGDIDFVRIAKIPEIVELENISIQEAIKNNTMPETLGYLNILRKE